MIPERNNYWLLDSVAGWRIASSDGIAFTADAGDITLDPLPADAILLDTALTSGIACPVALATDAKGRLLVIDGVTARVHVVDLDAQRSLAIEAFGGRGSELRRFRNPRSIAVLPSGAIAVADAGRVQLFSAAPYVLLQVWGSPERPIKPYALAADHCGILYIVDRKSRSILRARGDGEWLSSVGLGVLTDPIAVAVAPDQTVAVVDGQGTDAAVVIFPPEGAKPVRLTLVKSPLSLTFDKSGDLFVGTTSALISKIQQDDTQLSGWSLGGDGVSDFDGSVSATVWIAGRGLYAILNSSTPGTAPRLFSMDPAGAFRLTGSFVAGPLDSFIETCSWHRVQVNGAVPPGASLLIESSTSESAATGFTPFLQCASASGDNPDCLVQSAPGRYLQLRFTLQSNGAVTPQIHSLQVFFPRESYLQYLPSVFQDDDQSRLFLDRFLSIFQTTFDGLDNLVDNLWQYFDPYMVPEKYLPWLAAWIAVPLDPGLSLAQKRQILSGAFQTYTARGTPAGLAQVIQDYTGVSGIRILEHFRLRNWSTLPDQNGLGLGARLWSSNLFARLQVGVSSTVGSFRLTNSPQPASEPLTEGANQFSVFFPASPYKAADAMKSIQPILDREKPAWTQAFLCPVFPRLRVGVQATIGVDAYVGRADSMILGKLATLRYDAVLSRSAAARDIHALGVSAQPRLGMDARIL